MAAMLVAPALPAAAAANVRVHMHEFQFCPEVNGAPQCPGTTAGSVGIVTINPGDSVTWIYDEAATDPVPNCDSPQFQLPSPAPNCPGHSVTKPGQPFGVNCPSTSGSPGCPYTYTFNYSGAFDYYCAYHGGRSQGNTPLTPVVPNMDGRIVVNSLGSNNPPTNVNAGSGIPIANSTTAASSRDLPNTFVPGLPNAGGRTDAGGFLALGLVAALAVLTAFGAVLIGTLRALHRR